ncbi:TPA: DUF3114 domain-containing protein [Streptococcus suis]|nr:DUF3114 domain-containing protein [Streptococcus suis]
MIWLQKQPTNAVESLEEYLTSFSEKEQADYRLIFQKLTRQGWSGTVEERQDYLGRFSPDLSPEHSFWSEFSDLVRQVLKGQANSEIWQLVHPLRYLFSIQQAYWIRECFGDEGRSDREALLAYLSQLRTARID